MYWKWWFCACAVLIAPQTGARWQDSSKAELLSHLAGHLGYSPVCVAVTLANCQDPSGSPEYKKKEVEGTQVEKKEVEKKEEEKKEEEEKEDRKTDTKVNDTNRVGRSPRHCQDLKEQGDNVSGVREIFPYRCCPEWGIRVYCDQETDGGGWTLLQRRGDIKPREDFYRTWGEYQIGFGNLSGEYWIGLDIMHHLTSGDRLQELRIDLGDFEGVHRFASYGFFQVGDSASNYVMHCSRYTGDAGDSLAIQSGLPFSTYDRDNDVWDKNCAELHQGAWWYKECHQSNLNGKFIEGAYEVRQFAYGIEWKTLKNAYFHPLRDVTMMIRPTFR